MCSIFTSTVWFCLLNTTFLPELRPVRSKKIFKCISKQPFFWSLNATAAFAVSYDVLIMVLNEHAIIHVECLVIASKLWTLYLLYQLNFTFPPSRKKGFRAISRGAYYITMYVYVLDNLCKLVASSAQVAFKFYSVKPAYEVKTPTTIVGLLLMIANAALYHSFLQFFWLKIFRGNKDILRVVKQKFVSNIGIKVNRPDQRIHQTTRRKSV